MTRAETIEFLVEHAHSAKHRGRLDGADVAVTGGNPNCGDVVTVFLKVDRESDTVAAMTFEGEGCTISQAASSVLAEMVASWPLAEIEALDYGTMMDALGRDVVRSRPRCATLALGTLKAAVKKYRQIRNAEGSGEASTAEEPSASEGSTRAAACHGG